MIRNIPRDAWVGLFVLCLAFLYWFGATGIRSSSLEGGVGAAGLPKAYAYGLATLSVILIVRAFLLRATGRTDEKPVDSGVDDDIGHGRSPYWRHWRALGMLCLGVLYLLIVPYLGYLLSVMVLMGSVALYSGMRPSTTFVATVVLGGIFYYLLFVRTLGIPLPAGMWPSVFRSFMG